MPKKITSSKKYQNILIALLKLEMTAPSAPERTRVAIFSGCSDKMAGFSKTLGNMKKEGLVDYPSSQTVALTEVGRSMVADVFVPPATNDEMQDFIRKDLLKKCHANIFDDLLEMKGRPRIREALRAATGYAEKPAAFAKYLGEMKKLGIIEYSKDNSNKNKVVVELTDLVYPCGRPWTRLWSTAVCELVFACNAFNVSKSRKS